MASHWPCQMQSLQEQSHPLIELQWTVRFYVIGVAEWLAIGMGDFETQGSSGDLEIRFFAYRSGA